MNVSVGSGQGAAGSTIESLVFTNSGTSSCLIGGYPGVSFVTGSNGAQVGAAATRTGSGSSTFSLAPGASTQALLRIADTENYPSSTCKPVDVRGLRVYPPGQTAALFVALDGQTACSGLGSRSQLQIQPLTRS